MIRQQINLLEAMTIGEGIDLPGFHPWLFWGLMAAILFLGAGVYKRGSEISSIKRKITGLQTQVNTFQQKNGGEGLQGQREELNPASSRRIRWSPLMREISLIIPEGVWTTRWETIPVDGNGRPGMRMAGSALSYDRVAKFLTVLEHSVMVSDPKLAYARRIGGEVQFEILLRLRTIGEK
jgi:hypothetical protein